MTATTTLPVLFGTGVHASRPSASAVGSGGLYACSTHSLIYQTDGASTWSTWATLTGTGLTDPMTTRGDIIVRNSSNTTARLAIGSTGKVLQSDGTDISWQTPAAGSGVSGKKPIQSGTQNGSSNVNSQTLTISAPVNGNLLILVSARDDSGTISSITQTNVTWTLVAKASAAPMVEVWKGVVAASPGTGITAAYSTTSFTQFVVSEWNGITGTLVDTATISGSTTMGSRARTPVLLPTSASALVIGGSTTNSNANAYNITAGNLLDFDCEPANTMRMFAVYGFPGTVPCQATQSATGSSTISGVLVSLT